ncbi:hypothetical protein [Granulosicoccus sp. 3-233]|uniref:hypothetical protein n=1 Tax=Granulosicoccus sp. 3-233 TaxID=3417969 RepID=UPI003D3432A8
MSALQSLLDDCTQDDLSLINAYIVERAKQQQAADRAEQMARFRSGDRVTFTDKQGKQVNAVVVRPNKKTVTLRSDDDRKWNVSPELLQKVESADNGRKEPIQLSLVRDARTTPEAASATGHEREWVAGLIDAPGYITGEAGEPYRPQIFAWMNEIGQVIRLTLTGPNEPDLDLVQELRQAIDKPATGQAGAPSHIRVNDARQAELLKASFPSIRFVCAATPELTELQSTMQEEMGSAGTTMTYSSTGASTEAIGEFFDAAAKLYRAKPWKSIPHDQSLISVTIDALGVKNAALSVMGQMGQHFGIILFDQLAKHERFTLIGDAIHRGQEPDYPPHTFLSYEPAKEIEADMRKDISRHGWKVANTKAYPLLMSPNEDRIVRPMTPRDLTLFTVIAEALSYALSAEEFIDSHHGLSSSKSNQTFSTESGPVTVELETPYPYEKVMRENGAPDSIFARLIAMERTREVMDWDLHDTLSEQLQEKYLASPEGRAIGNAASISTLLMSFSFNYMNCTIATLVPTDLESILYEIIPSKVMMPASEAANMIEDARAFFSFLKRAYQSVHAERCLSVLTDEAIVRMTAAMDNPNLFGMGKSVLSEGTGFPFDLPDIPSEPLRPSATKPKPKDSKSRKKQRAASRKARKKNR